MLIAGIDLAWGDRKPDGVCLLEAGHRRCLVTGFAYPRGDAELISVLSSALRAHRSALLTVDAPIIVPNAAGTRPVDRLTHTLFHREHAACHPANSTKCPRPPRILRKLRRLGFRAGWELRSHPRLVAEVYPHPAMVRLFRLDRIVKYKRGTVAERRSEFARLQQLMREFMSASFPELALNAEAEGILSAPWSKPIEDRLDALFCALIGLWHWKHNGRKSDPIGNTRTGFILLPVDLRGQSL